MECPVCHQPQPYKLDPPYLYLDPIQLYVSSDELDPKAFQEGKHYIDTDGSEKVFQGGQLVLSSLSKKETEIRTSQKEANDERSLHLEDCPHHDETTCVACEEFGHGDDVKWDHGHTT